MPRDWRSVARSGSVTCEVPISNSLHFTCKTAIGKKLVKIGHTLDLIHGGIAFGAAFLAGAINSVAGGGTLGSFSALIWLGLNSVGAEAASTVGVWPGAGGGGWGYRRELAAAEPRFRVLIVPSLIGGITGALLLRWTPPAFFDRLVPFLILFATLLFTAQDPVQRLLKTADAGSHQSGRWLAGALLFQLGVGIYGGYFGAGIGILDRKSTRL